MLALAFLLISFGCAVAEVPVRKFWGQDTTLLDPSDSVTLHWFIEPGDATVYWIRCYTGRNATVSNHFFTYIHDIDVRWVSETFDSFLRYSFQYGTDIPIVFGLTFISGVFNTISGVYTCELEGDGMSDPIFASLRLQVYLRKTFHAVSKQHPVTTEQNGAKPPPRFGFGHNDTTAMSIGENMDERYRVLIWITVICISSTVGLFIGSIFGATLMTKCHGALSRLLPSKMGKMNSTDDLSVDFPTGDGENNQETSIPKKPMPVKEGILVDLTQGNSH